MLYLYGLLEPGNGSLDLTDIDGLEGINGPVSTSPCGDLILVHGHHGGGDILPRRRSLLSHARILEAAMNHGTVLPMRFGMVSSSVEDVRTRIDRRLPEVEAALNRLRGCVELGVRVTGPETAVLDAALAAEPELAHIRTTLAGSSRHGHFEKVELGRRVGEVLSRRRGTAQKAVLSRLLPLADDHVLCAPDTDFEILRAEFLINRKRLAEFSEMLSTICESTEFSAPEPASAHLIGPGPAFNFVTLALGDGPEEKAA